MTRLDKLIDRILSLPNDMRFEEIEKVLTSYGYSPTFSGGGSSHCVFRKPGCNPITVPKHRPIKRTYVELVKEVIENEQKDATFTR